MQKSLSLIWAARHGLSESELLDLLGRNGRRLPGAQWTPLYLAIESSLIHHSGLLSFGHEYLRVAVETKLVAGPKLQRTAHLALADYFDSYKETTPRKIAELPWNLWQADETDRLRSCLLQMEMFSALQEHNQQELLTFWQRLKDETRIGEFY